MMQSILVLINDSFKIYLFVGKSSTSSLRTITSFFLPTNTVKTLHLSCTTNARQLIVMLLRKFKVADNPLKFALYEREYEPTLQGQTYRCN